MVGDKDIRMSTGWYVFTIGGTKISWISKLQKVVSLSTTKVVYVVATKASKEIIWLQRFMEELGKKQENSRLYCDSESAIHLAKNSAFHSKNKNIKLRYHFIRSTLEDGYLKLEKIHTSQNPADMLTKGVTRDKMSSCLVSVFKNEDEDEEFSRSKKVQIPAYTATVELLRSISKWEIVGCRA